MCVSSNTPKYVCLDCRNKIPMEDMEGIFYDELKAFFTHSVAITRHLGHARANLNEKQQCGQVPRSEIGKVREQMKQTHELDLGPADFRGRLWRPRQALGAWLGRRLSESASPPEARRDVRFAALQNI